MLIQSKKSQQITSHIASQSSGTGLDRQQNPLKYSRMPTEQGLQHQGRYLQQNLFLSSGKNSQSAPKLSVQLTPNPQSRQYLPPISTRERFSLEHCHTEAKQDPIDRNLIRDILKNSYEQKIQAEQLRKDAERRQKIMQEKDYLSQFSEHVRFQAEQKRKIKNSYKKQLLSEIKEKKVAYNHAKTEEIEISRKLQQPRQQHLSHKSLAYRNYFIQALKFQNQVQNQYKNYMKDEQKYIKARNKDKIMDYKQNFELMGHQGLNISRLERQKNIALRKILDEQVHKHQQEKQALRQSSRSKKRKTENYDPISNPIDFKLDIHNKYLMSQLARQNHKKPGSRTGR